MTDPAPTPETSNGESVAPPPPPDSDSYEPSGDLRRKWGGKVIDKGWTVVPNLLIEYQQQLQLEPIELNVLLILLKHWWRAEDSPPWPTKKRMADITGRGHSAIQRAIQRLEKKGLVQRSYRYLPDGGGQTSNGYALDGLVRQLKDIADEDTRLREKQEEEKGRKRRGRK